MANEDHMYRRAEQVVTVQNRGPHVAILGAGASLAAFPRGDADGAVLPLMNNFVNVVGLTPLLAEHGVENGDGNFELVYSELWKRDAHATLLSSIERKVRQYFENLQLPQHPTIYDELLLCLRQKDVIATFNWDPFLFDAWDRNRHVAELPHLVFLHGNVRVGCCLKDRVKGRPGDFCPRCDQRLEPCKLLYPVGHKDYKSDRFIAEEWTRLQAALDMAFTLTIFGYGAPDSDKEAVELMKQAWGGKRIRQFEMVELIDIKETATLEKQWAPFLFSHHYRHRRAFSESWIHQYPRRTCETLYAQTMDAKWAEDNPLPAVETLDELWNWLDPLLSAEQDATTERGRNE